MAETVKKSRIVSDADENLEESLMEEFNLRLKNCMNNDEVVEEVRETHYENLEVLKNGVDKKNHILPDLTNGGSQHFIDIERDHITSNLKTATYVNSGSQMDQRNGFQETVSKTKTDIPNPETVTIPEPVYDVPKLPPQEISSTTSFDQIDHIVTVLENTVPKPVFNLPVTCLVDLSSDPKNETPPETKSAKDRMLLSTDDTSCLLFTQTVTSPMLTPSEENVDFLKALQSQTVFPDKEEQSEKEIVPFDPNVTISSDKDVPVFDPNVTISDPDSEVLEPESEDNSKREDLTEEEEKTKNSDPENEKKDLGENGNSELIYENAEFLQDHADNLESIYENVEIIRETSKRSSSSDCKAAGSEISGDVDVENVLNLKENSGNGDFKAETSKFIQNEIEYVENEDLLKPSTKNSLEDVITPTEETTSIIPDIKLEEGTPLSSPVEEEPPVELPKAEIPTETTSSSSPDKLKDNFEDVGNNADALSRPVVDDEPRDSLETEPEEKEESIKEEVVPEGTQLNLEPLQPEKIETIDEMKYTKEDVVIKESTIESSMSKFESEKVKSLKMHFMKNTDTNESLVMVQKAEEKELEELKSFNIMKKISKFESNSALTKDAETTNAYSNSHSNCSTVTHTETHYVETSSDLHNGDEKAVKKKKSKKSKKDHEKENISVTETREEESFYNVNVKNLCRSFGDLTKIEKEKDKSKLDRNNWRTKSLNDVRPLSLNQKIDVFKGVSVRALKSSFNKFDALQKKNVLHVRSSDASKAQEKFAGGQIDNSNCKACEKPVFQMELVKAEKAVWHKGCFRCTECKKQLTVDTFESNEGNLYCKPHFKALFAPKVVDDDIPPSDKPDLGLEELQSLNVKERFQVFEHHQIETNQLDKSPSPVNVKRSPSILSKLARFQAKGMNVGVTDESLNGIPIELSESENEEEEDDIEGEDADLIRAKRVQKEKPFHFVQLSDVKNKWENVNENSKDERREERKQEIQTIRSRLFLGKQGKMKEAYQQAILETETGHGKKNEPIDIERESADTRTIKEKFERGELTNEEIRNKEQEDMSVFESGISKKSRSIFQELDANSSKPTPLSPVTTPKLGFSVRNARDAYLNRTTSEDVVKSTDEVDEIVVRTEDIQDRFKFFETYREPEKQQKQFRFTPPREGQVKVESPEREIYRDPELVRSEDYVEDSVVAKQTHTATKMLNKFRQMEENLYKDNEPQGPKPLKRFTPPREPIRRETSSEEESGSEEESEEGEENERPPVPDQDLLEAQKAARARQLRAKFERWEADEIKKENASVNIVEEIGSEDQSQIETTRSLRARFESLKETSNAPKQAPKVKVNRFVEPKESIELCNRCHSRVYPLERLTLHGLIYHKGCFKCMECNAVLRMDSYCYNKGILYCTAHFKRLFISKGDYDTGFGLENTKEKWNIVAS